ncbi:uncharacterized protein MONOS_17078 [Monocercomonoides exilis]|uniref:uncharacterized protein n=1 Tax=Monocercomonoides exilis TaxID=2049356 RepID=UPI0035594BD1|nr:hypothetical protein MONOS_17078 [Monocercomonoides exilis]
MLVMVQLVREREPAVRKKRGVVIDDEDGIVPVMVVVLRLREGELSERWKKMGRADEADGSGEEIVDEDENEENDDVVCDECEYEFDGETNVSVWMCAKVDLRRMREASWGRAKPLRAYSMVAHGVCWGLPQVSASVPLLETILFWAMRGSQPLYTSLSAVP